MPTRYRIAGIPFASKRAVAEYTQQLKDPPVLCGPLNGHALAFVCELLANHPNAAEKIGSGVAQIHVIEALGTRAFEILRTDGTRIDFSYKKCVYPQTARQNFRTACRTAVNEEIIRFKRAAFADATTIVCPVLNIDIAWDDAHVDHVPPHTFAWIVDSFISTLKIDVNTVTYAPGFQEPAFTRPALRQKFAHAHRETAVLRVVSARANLSDIKRLANRLAREH